MKQTKSRFWIRLLCWILAGLMVVSAATTLLTLLFGMLS